MGQRPAEHNPHMQLQQAFALHQSGKLTEAAALYRKLLDSYPKSPAILTNLGNIELQHGNIVECVKLIRKSLGINNNQPYAHNNCGIALYALKRLDDALEHYRHAVSLKPDYAEAHYNRGNIFAELKRLDDALASYDRATALKPDYAEAYNNRGIVLVELKRLDEALASYERAIALKPGYAEACNNRGIVLVELKRLDEALASYERAIALKPDHAEAYTHRGIVLAELERFDDALASYERAIALKPDYAEACNNRGIVLAELKRFDDALASYDRAIALKPDHAESYDNRGLALSALNRFDDALASYDRAIALKPDCAKAYNHRGMVLAKLKRLDDALESYAKSIALKPDYADAHNHRGIAFTELKRLDEAFASYERAVALKPDYAEAYQNFGNLLTELKRLDDALACYEHAISLKPDQDFLLDKCAHTRMHLCEWGQIEALTDDLFNKIFLDEKPFEPFIVQALIDSAEAHKKCAENYTRTTFPEVGRLASCTKYKRHEKIRIGYFSSDFGNHPVTHLLAGMFEEHDKDKFELTGFSLASHDDKWRSRVERAFDKIIDVRFRSDREIALLARSMEIDIAVDLNGLTADSRTGVFAERAAPMQVSYIGFLGTMGASYIDYLIADKCIIPPESRKFYAEKICYLPNYQCNDDKPVISGREFSRSELGLPERGFVFCCFNQNYKITPRVFNSWMNILRRVPESVLWLYATDETARKNLKKEAEKSGINSDRLVFARSMLLEDHLSRQRLADLFLDTHPYNAGATASNALRAGLPVLTYTGNSFASRYGASLLNSVGLPEMITTTLEEYEELAVGLASSKEMSMRIKQKLASNLQRCALFDTKQFTRTIEAAFTTMYERHHDGRAPDLIVVE